MSIGIAAARQYCLWLVSGAGFRDQDLIITHEHGTLDQYRSIKALTFRCVKSDLCFSVPIPNPSMENWKPRVVRRSVSKERTPPKKLTAPWGMERSKLVGHPTTLEEYAKNPL